jgi:hypothetical protein
MSGNFVQSALLREIYWAGRRIGARFTGGVGPKVFLNSIPKAGTHLAMVELSKLGFRSAAVHVKTREVNLAAQDKRPNLEFRGDVAAFGRYARKVRPGQYLTAHLPWDRALFDFLLEEEFRPIMMVRDPRAMLVSRYHYILGLKRHYLHGVLADLPDDLNRFRILLKGSADPVVHGVRQQLERYLPWVGHPGVLTIRFEDLVGESGGGSHDAKVAALKRVAEFLSVPPDDLDALARTAPRRTATLRKGRIDGWRRELPASILDDLEQRIGDLCRKLGYAGD